MTNSKTADDLRQKLLSSAGDIRLQLNLLDACIAAGRNDWASAVYAEIRRLADLGAGLLPASPGQLPPTAPTAPAKRKWTPATPEQILRVLNGMIGSRPEVKSEGPLVVVSFNGHLLNADKAQRLMDPLLYLVRRAHVVMFQESNVDALRLIGKAAHYGLNASHRNSREQACGILYHPRLQWLGEEPVYHDYLLNVEGHPEFKVTLRPALQRRVKDLASGFVVDLINWHGKSNVGGPDETRPIRRHQFEQLVAELKRQLEKSPYEPRKLPGKAKAAEGAETATANGAETATASAPDFSGEELPLKALVLGGDFNAPLERPETTEIQPLLDFGLKLERTEDNRWSYRYKTEGGQFDGFLTFGLDGTVQPLWIPSFPESKLEAAWYRDFSDHLPVFLELMV